MTQSKFAVGHRVIVTNYPMWAPPSEQKRNGHYGHVVRVTGDLPWIMVELEGHVDGSPIDYFDSPFPFHAVELEHAD